MPSRKECSEKLVAAAGDLDDVKVDSGGNIGLSQLMQEMESLQKRHQGEVRLLFARAGRQGLLNRLHVDSRRRSAAKDESSNAKKPDDVWAQDCSSSHTVNGTGRGQANGITNGQAESGSEVVTAPSATTLSSTRTVRGNAKNERPRREVARKTDRTLQSIVRKKAMAPDIAEECVFETSRDRLLEQRTKLQRIVQSQYYEWSSGLLICLNAIFIGYQTELLAQSIESRQESNDVDVDMEQPLHIMIGSMLFTTLFCIELGLRWFSDGLLRFFVSSDLAWRLFDVFIVILSLADTMMDLVKVSSSFLNNISVLRVLRVVRIVKLARIIRLMSFFRELRLMIYSILGCMKSLLWVTLILGMCFYVFGITFTLGTTEYVLRNKLLDEPALPLRLDFGTLSRSFLSLYMAMAGGRSWGEYYKEMSVLPPQFPALFLVYMTFTIFAVLNIVTGVFVDSAFQANHKSRQLIIHEELEQKREYLQALKDLFSEMDVNLDGAITAREFDKTLRDERVIAFFRAMKLDVSDSRALFNILDKDKSGLVDVKEFLDGCYQLQGEARTIDTKIIRIQIEQVMERMKRLEDLQQELLLS